MKLLNEKYPNYVFLIIYFALAIFSISQYMYLQADLSSVLYGVFLALVPAVGFAYVIWKMVPDEKEPVWMVSTCFIWGSSIAIVISLVMNSVLGRMLASLVGMPTGQVTATFVAPIIEELSKSIILIVLFTWKKDEFHCVMDGVIYAAMVGLGFAMSENIFYYTRAFFADGTVSGMKVFYMRGIASPLAHPFFTAMTGIALYLSKRAKGKIGALIYIASGLLCAILLHAVWNGSTILGQAGFRLMYRVIFLPAVIFFVVTVYLRMKYKKKNNHILKGE